MWTSIYVASNKEQADKIKSQLEEGGIMTNVRALGHQSDDESQSYEIRVLASEIDEAQEILCGQNYGI
ncbi:MAG: hypothetical protein PUI81_04285 [Veillonellaceae bacterium]|nr:glutamate decarboxylase [Veillonellaceae bacterium]MDD6923327.1 hypothetical protein [Veillonellaceae bacterium]